MYIVYTDSIKLFSFDRINVFKDDSEEYVAMNRTLKHNRSSKLIRMRSEQRNDREEKWLIQQK